MKIHSLPALFFLFIVAGTLFAQPINMDLFKGMKPRSIGPAAMSGRITAVAVHPSYPNVIYAGSASGGLWKSDNGGVLWAPVFDKQPNQSIGSIAINPVNPQIIWAGTGEGNPRNSLNTGNGIYKSLDAGFSWQNMGLINSKTIHRILINPNNPDIVYAGVLGSPWGPGSERGVFKTIDGGKTWKRILFINDTSGVADMVMDPTNPDKIIVAMWQHERKPWTFNSGGAGSGIHVTLNGGDTWKKLTEKDGLPDGDLGRIGLAIASNKPNVIYALIEAKKNGLYKSDDGGVKWALVSDKNIGDRPFYYAELYVDPTNENRLFNLYSSIARSEDGGKTFSNISENMRSIHPDNHAFYISPKDHDYMLLGNDGGLYMSRDGGYHWQFMSGIPVGQFYHVNVDNQIPYMVYGGLQDNGTYVGPSATWKNSGLRNAEWQEVFFGDGFDCMPQKDDPRYLFAMSQGGSLGYVDKLTGKTQSIRPIHPEGKPLRFNWNAALAQNPFAVHGIYYGSQYLHKSDDLGQSWSIISPDLTTNNPAKQNQDKSGGLTIDATGAENHCTIVSIAPSPKEQGVIWVGTDDGNVQLTKDGGTTWSNLTSKIMGMPAGAWIPQIEASNYNAAEAFVVVNNYRQNDWRPMVFATKDYGITWTKLVDERKVNGYAWCITQDPIEPNLLFVGTDEGLFFSLDGGKVFQRWTNDYPSVPTADLKIHPRDHDLVIGTFGRAFYILDDIRPLREIAANRNILEKKLRIFTIPDAIQAQSKSYDGEHFGADGLYAGMNKTMGAMLSVWLKDKSKTDSTSSIKKQDELKIRILDSKGILIRTLSRKVEQGLNRFYWNLDRKGERFPQSGAQAERGEGRFFQDPNAEPGGIQILPGQYKVIVQYGTEQDSSMINVMQDPRLILPMETLLEKQRSIDQYLALVKKTTAVVNKLKEAKSTIRLVGEVMNNAPDTVKTRINAMGKSLEEKIKSLSEIFFTPEDFKGIDRADRLVGNLQRASQFVNSADGAPGSNAQNAIKKVTAEVNEASEKVNSFFLKEWLPYQKTVESTQVSLFKKINELMK
jgi:photosystem II stability/assembly factor-like uncharacterized protein